MRKFKVKAWSQFEFNQYHTVWLENAARNLNDDDPYESLNSTNSVVFHISGINWINLCFQSNMVPNSPEIFINNPFEKLNIIKCDRPRWVDFAKNIDYWNQPSLNDRCHPLCCFVKIMRLKEGFSLPIAVRQLRNLSNTNTENDQFITSVKLKLKNELPLALRSWCRRNKVDGIIGDINQNKQLLQMIIHRMEDIQCNFWNSYKGKVYIFSSNILKQNF